MNQDNINSLIQEAILIEAEAAKKAGALGYTARALVQATLPHKKVDGNEFKRTNGAFRLTVLADSDIGIPYGSYPRLIMAWISTEAVLTKNRTLILGHSLSDFMGQLDLIPSGGRWGTISNLKNQMQKLFTASISCTYDDGNRWAIKNIQPVSEADLWWDPKNPGQTGLFESSITLGETFFNEVISNPIPIDMRALKALKQSAMALDIYCWLTYRMSYLKKNTCIPWGALELQFGSDYKRTRKFKEKFLSHLKAVQVVYSHLKIEQNEQGLILKPSLSHIPIIC